MTFESVQQVTTTAIVHLEREEGEGVGGGCTWLRAANQDSYSCSHYQLPSIRVECKIIDAVQNTQLTDAVK